MLKSDVDVVQLSFKDSVWTSVAATSRIHVNVDERAHSILAFILLCRQVESAWALSRTKAYKQIVAKQVFMITYACRIT